MEKQNPKRKNVLFWADILLTAASLAGTAYTLQDIWDDRSFGGFGSLFLLLILYPYFIALAAAVVFMLWSARSGRRWPAAVAASLKIVGPIPWLWLVCAIESPLS